MYYTFKMVVDHLRFFTYLLLNYIVGILRTFYWWMSGRAAQISAAKATYETSGHKMGIAYKHILDYMDVLRMRNFVLYHEEFVHPEYVLRDEVTLMQLEGKDAVFVESVKEGEPVHKAFYSFLFVGQFIKAKRIITMPISSLLRLSEEMKDDGGKLIFLHNQARCGSTLLTSIFDHSLRCVALSEPLALIAVVRQITVDKIWNEDESRRILRAVIRILCKPYRSAQHPVLAYVIKPSPTILAAADMIQELFPDHTPLFIYREPTAVGISFRRMGQVLPSLKLMYLLMKWKVPEIAYRALDDCGEIPTAFKGFTPQSGTGIEFGYYVALQMLKLREECRERGIDMPAIRFKDLISNPRAMIEKIFAVCGLPQLAVDNAMDAMKKDSQSATKINQAELKKAMPVAPKPTPAFIEEMRAVAQKLGLPEPEEWTDDLRIANSILP